MKQDDLNLTSDNSPGDDPSSQVVDHESSLAERIAKWVWRATSLGIVASVFVHIVIALIAGFIVIGGLPPSNGGNGGDAPEIQMALMGEAELDALLGPQVEASTPLAPELEVVTPVESALVDAIVSDVGEEQSGGIATDASELGGGGDISGAGIGGEGIGGSGSGGASFFGVEAQGNRFAYIVDISGSMQGARIIKLQNELAKSIDAMLETSAFIVVPFETDSEPLGKKVAWRDANNAGKSWARNEIAGMVTRGGTQPFPAFQIVFTELRPRPDAIYFMTDGEFDEETVRLIAELNSRLRIPIHCICYASADGEKNLKKIAKDSRGTYTFVPE